MKQRKTVKTQYYDCFFSKYNKDNPVKMLTLTSAIGHRNETEFEKKECIN